MSLLQEDLIGLAAWPPRSSRTAERVTSRAGGLARAVGVRKADGQVVAETAHLTGRYSRAGPRSQFIGRSRRRRLRPSCRPADRRARKAQRRAQGEV